uniref:NADH dehydrogenase [ubiquinone] 1 alpha subcomplex subunit 9, mitochondrial n=1 Tax=Clastoptera arizonana TaxID=38151 RepID=A0A1B6DM59_9HEMI
MASLPKPFGLVLIRNQIVPGALVGAQKMTYSTEVKNKLPTLKKGTGGRSSFNGIVATVFGNSGFLGTYVCNRLGKIGTQLILPYRGDHYDCLRLKMVGDLGQVLFQPFNLKDEESIYKSVKYSNVVINLIGRDWETKNFSFKDVNVTGPRLLAKICREAGVEKFIHLSALNAEENPSPHFIKGGSKFLATKWEGEQAVREEFPNAIIFRPADVYGSEDRFLRVFAHKFRHNVHWMPLWKKGEHTIKQPVFVSDVAAGIIQAVKDRDAVGKTYQAAGPKRYLLSELVDYFHRVMRKQKEWGYLRYDLRYDPFFQLRIAMSDYASPYLNPAATLVWDKIERECVSDTIDSTIPTLEDLGVVLTHVEHQVPWELKPYRSIPYYDEELGEFEKPTPPAAVV